MDLAKGVVLARVTLEGFDLAQLRPFVPPTLASRRPPAARSVALDVKAERAEPAPKIAIAGEARIEGLAIHKAAKDAAAPEIVKVGRVAVTIKDAQPLAGVIALDTVTIDGVDLRVTRLKDGRIDLLELASAAGTGATAGPAAGAPPGPVVASAPAPAAPAAEAMNGDAARADAARNQGHVPRRDREDTLALNDVTATVRDVAWPGRGPTDVRGRDRRCPARASWK